MADITPTPGFFDGLGDRVVVHDRTIGALEVLRLRPELTADAAFEPKLRARIQQLAAVRHPSLGRARHVGRLAAPDLRLAIVSDLADGLRLSEVLQAIEQLNLPLHTNAALFLLRQLVAAVASLHAAGPDVSHGALGPERLVISPTGRLVAVEHVLGAALPHLPHTQPARVWKDLRLVVAADEQPPFGRRTDVLQVGLCGLALVRSRALRVEEYPLQVAELLDGATESTITGDRRPLRTPLRAWIARAIQAGDAQAAPWTIEEAHDALEAMLASDGYLATPTGLATLLENARRYLQGLDVDTQAEALPQDVGGAAPTCAVRIPTLSTPAPVAPSAPAPAAPSAPAPVALTAPAPVALTAPAPVALTAPAPVAPSAPAPPAPQVAHLRLVSPSPSPWTRTEGALAVAAPMPVPPEPGDDIAPEVGVSFPPDEPELEPEVSAPPMPAPSRPPSGAVPIAATVSRSSPSASGGVEALASAAPVAPPIADVLAEPVGVPIAATLARESLADLVHTRPGRSEGSAGHRVQSGSVRAARPIFGGLEEDRPFAARRAGLSLPLKAAAAAVILIVLAVPGWFLFGRGGSDAPKPVRPARTAPAPLAPAERAPSAKTAPPREPAGSEALPSSLAGAAAAAAEAGSLQIESPFPLDVFEDGVKLGTTQAPIVIGAGRHVLELANGDYAFRGRQPVDIRPGRATRVAAKLPTGVANINATPWAEVWIDGVRAGETPLGNLALTIGPHEAVFRHPQLGEQARSLVITTGAPTRMSVEMKQ